MKFKYRKVKRVTALVEKVDVIDLSRCRPLNETTTASATTSDEVSSAVVAFPLGNFVYYIYLIFIALAFVRC
jgi:hypothetical protein